LLIKRLFEAVEGLLEVFLLILTRLQEELAEVLVRVRLEVVLDFDGLAFVRHLDESLVFGALEHLRSQLLAIEWVVDPLLHVGLLLLGGHLG